MKFLFLFLFPLAAFAQSVPNGTITQGEVWTPAQWNYAWQSKQDYPIPSGGVPFSALPSLSPNTVLGSVAGGAPGALSTLPLLANPLNIGSSLYPVYQNLQGGVSATISAGAGIYTWTCNSGCSALYLGAKIGGNDSNGVSIWPAQSGQVGAIVVACSPSCTSNGATITDSIAQTSAATAGTYTINVGANRFDANSTTFSNEYGYKNMVGGQAAINNSPWSDLYLVNDCSPLVRTTSCILMAPLATNVGITSFIGARTSDVSGSINNVENNTHLLVVDSQPPMSVGFHNSWNDYLQTEVMPWAAAASTYGSYVTLTGVAVAGSAGQITFSGGGSSLTPYTPVTITGGNTGSGVIANGTYLVTALVANTSFTLTTLGGGAISTTAGTVSGQAFNAPVTIGATTPVTITGTAGQFAFSGGTPTVGSYVIITGTNSGTGTITGYVSGTEYYVSAATASTFTLKTMTSPTVFSNQAIVTAVNGSGTTTGLNFQIVTGDITISMENTIYNFGSQVDSDPYNPGAAGQTRVYTASCGQANMLYSTANCTSAMHIAPLSATPSGSNGFLTGILFVDGSLVSTGNTGTIANPPAIAMSGGTNAPSLTWYPSSGCASDCYLTPGFQFYATSTSVTGNYLWASDTALTTNLPLSAPTATLPALNAASTGTGTITIGNTAGPSTVNLSGPFTYAAGTALSAANWGTTSPTFNAAASTLNDTTASGTVGSDYVYTFQAPSITSTGGAATTITNVGTLWVAAPTCSGGVVCTNLFSIGTTGRIYGSGGLTITGNSVSLNASSNFNVNLATGSSTGTVHIADGSAASSVIIGSTSTGNTNLSAAAGKLILTNVSTGTNADFLCMQSGGAVLIQASSCTISSARFKEAIYDYTRDAMAVISRLAVVGFTLKDTQNRDHNAMHPQVGLLAENVADVEPRCAVYESDMETPKSYRAECVTAILVKAAQQQQSTVDSQARDLRRQQIEIYLLALWCLSLTGYLIARRK